MITPVTNTGFAVPPQLISLAGIAAILLLALLLSNARKQIRLRIVGAAFALQAGIALLDVDIADQQHLALALKALGPLRIDIDRAAFGRDLGGRRGRKRRYDRQAGKYLMERHLLHLHLFPALSAVRDRAPS